MTPTKVPQYLLVILQLLVQDDSVGLVGLGPGQDDAVHGAAHLVHDGHSRRGWKRQKEGDSQTPAQVGPSPWQEVGRRVIAVWSFGIHFLHWEGCPGVRRSWILLFVESS